MFIEITIYVARQIIKGTPFQGARGPCPCAGAAKVDDPRRCHSWLRHHVVHPRHTTPRPPAAPPPPAQLKPHATRCAALPAWAQQLLQRACMRHVLPVLRPFALPLAECAAAAAADAARCMRRKARWCCATRLPPTQLSVHAAALCWHPLARPPFAASCPILLQAQRHARSAYSAVYTESVKADAPAACLRSRV